VLPASTFARWLHLPAPALVLSLHCCPLFVRLRIYDPEAPAGQRYRRTGAFSRIARFYHGAHLMTSDGDILCGGEADALRAGSCLSKSPGGDKEGGGGPSGIGPTHSPWSTFLTAAAPNRRLHNCTRLRVVPHGGL
jgi:hypothetical protein